MKKYMYLGLFILLILGLFALSWYLNPKREEVERWASFGVECLTGGHIASNEVQHIHPDLKILVDGNDEIIPADIGIVSTCMAEVHTHDATGKIHIESYDAKKQFVLEQFFSVWGKNLERDGFALSATLGTEPLPDPAKLVLLDLQQIVLNYTSIKK